MEALIEQAPLTQSIGLQCTSRKRRSFPCLRRQSSFATMTTTVCSTRASKRCLVSPISSTLSLSGSDDIQKVMDPPVEKRTLLLRKWYATQEQTTGLKDMLSKVEVQEISFPSDLEFKPKEGGKQGHRGAKDKDEDEMTSKGALESDGDDSPKPCKCKANCELALSLPKKCTFVEM